MRSTSSGLVVSRLLVGSACLGLALLATGCGSSGTVTGKITYDGKTLGGGTVVFHAEGKPAVTATIDLDGNYTASKVPTGVVRIAIETDSVRPVKAPPAAAGKMAPPDGVPAGASGGIYSGEKVAKGRYVKIPENYNDVNKSGLTLTVQGGSQTHNIDLKPETK